MRRVLFLVATVIFVAAADPAGATTLDGSGGGSG